MRLKYAIPILLCVLVLTGACSKPTRTDVPTANSSRRATSAPSSTGDALAFARCLREHGVPMPDPDPTIQWGNLNQLPQWDTAYPACRNLQPPSNGGNNPPSAQELEQLRVYAACMREHAVEMADPDQNGNLVTGGRFANMDRTQVDNDPAYKAAVTACQDKLPDNLKQGPGK
jgi:hypothetical protein